MSFGEVIVISVYVIGFIISVLYQKKKINALLVVINSQKAIIDNLGQFMNIIDISKIREYTKMREESISLQHQKELIELQTAYKLKLNEISSSNLGLNDELRIAASAVMRLLLFIGVKERRLFVDEMDDCRLKQILGYYEPIYEKIDRDLEITLNELRNCGQDSHFELGAGHVKS